MSAQSVLFDDLGPRGRRMTRIVSILAIGVVAALVGIATNRLADKGVFAEEMWQPFTIWTTYSGLFRAFGRILQAAAFAMVVACLVGALMALARLARNRPLRWISGIYVELFRAIPVYVLITFAFFGLPQFHVQLPAYWSLVLGLSLYNSAMLAEIFRAGILSLDRGQTEAATALGMTYWQSMLQVVVPQAARRMIPGLISQLVALLKDTSLGGALTYFEVLKQSQIIANFYGNLLPMLFAAAVIYMSVNMVLSAIARKLEVRQRRRYKAAPIQVTGGSEDIAGAV